MVYESSKGQTSKKIKDLKSQGHLSKQKLIKTNDTQKDSKQHLKFEAPRRDKGSDR